MHRRVIAELLHIPPPPIDDSQQAIFDFGAHASRAAHRRREMRANAGIERAV